MSHEILGDRFFSDRKQAAWHGIMRDGIEDRDYTAQEVLSVIGNLYVSKVPLQTVQRNKAGEHVTSPYYGILRQPTEEDPQPRWLGQVTEEYELVTPAETAELWDTKVARQVRSAAYLRDGKLFFLSCKLPAFDVKGEEIENYGVILNWMDGGNATTAMTTSVCPVCMNTVQWGLSVAKQTYKFKHDSLIRHRMGEWFTQVIGKAEKDLPELQRAAQAMASFRLTADVGPAVAKSVLYAAYPQPVKPQEDKLAPPEWNVAQWEKYEVAAGIMQQRRATAFDLFKGKGTGMDLPSRKGTLWGLYQGVCELEDYRGGSKGEVLASSILIGERGDSKKRAFNAAFEIVTGQPVTV